MPKWRSTLQTSLVEVYIVRTCSLHRHIRIVLQNIHPQHVFISSLLTHDGTMEAAFYSWCFLHKNRLRKKKKTLHQGDDIGDSWIFLLWQTDTSYNCYTQSGSFEENPKTSWVALMHPPAQKTVALKCARKSETQNRDKPRPSTAPLTLEFFLRREEADISSIPTFQAAT